LPYEDALDYDILKLALLKHYQLSADGLQLKLWLIELPKAGNTFQDLFEMIVKDKFLTNCSKKLATYLKNDQCYLVEMTRLMWRAGS